MDCCPMESLSCARWVEEKNPYLALNLIKAKKTCIHFPKVSIRICDDTEVLFIQGVVRAFDSLKPFLERGGRVIFLERDIDKILAFLYLPEFIPHERIEILLDEPCEYLKVGKRFFAKKQQFIGKLSEFRSYLDEVCMILSEYQELGKTVLQNIQGVLLGTRSFIKGKELEGVCRGSAAIVCGSGPSLLLHKERLEKMQGEALIFAAGSSLLTLVEWGIRVDGWFFIDPWPEVQKYEKVAAKGIPLFYQNRMNEELFRMHEGPKIWMGTGSFPMEEWIYRQLGIEPFSFDCGWNAGCFALHGAYFLGCDAIELIGMDGGERKDLERGLSWMQEFLKGHPNRGRGEKRVSEFLKAPCTLDLKSVQEVVQKMNDPRLSQVTGAFLKRLQKEISREEFEREKGLVEAEFAGEPLYEYVIEPLWKLFREEEGYEEEVVAKMLFAKEVLQFQEILRFYPSGALYDKKRKEGFSFSFYETGELRARVFYRNGILDGPFCLYAKNTVVLRTGVYVNGKKEGRHTISGEEGEIRFSGEFKEDQPIGRHVRTNERGVVVEELFYHNAKKFDRKLYSSRGELICEGAFTKEDYIEKQYAGGGVVRERKGVWNGSAVVWD